MKTGKMLNLKKVSNRFSLPWDNMERNSDAHLKTSDRLKIHRPRSEDVLKFHTTFRFSIFKHKK